MPTKRAPSLTVPSTHLTLEDIARDAFRRQFFLDAFGDERETLDRSFSFLERVREFKQLLGRRDAVHTVAELIVDEYLRDASCQPHVFLPSPPITALVQRIVTTVENKRSTPDLFSGLESHVNDRLETEKYAAFLQMPQYTQLCDALRKHRELPLGEILVDARSTRFLEQHVRQTEPSAIGNLLFWVEVQTVFLPLIQTNVVSVTLFEEIQATVRRLYNEYLTDSSSVMATIVPETLRKDILKRILQLQGEPFSPSRYATLFRQAQEKIWHWMQTMVYPKFHSSMLYVALVVETENLETDRQLRKLSEHVQHTTTTTSKASTLVVPVESMHGQRLLGDARYIRVVVPRQSEEKPCEWVTTMSLPSTVSTEAHIAAIRVVSVSYADEDGHVEFKYELNASDMNSLEGDEGQIDCMDFVWNWRQAFTLPALLSPSQRTHGSVEVSKPSFHSFSFPIVNTSVPMLHGYVVTTWTQSSLVNSSSTDSDITSVSTPKFQWLPRFVFVLASERIAQHHIVSGLRRLAEVPIHELKQDELTELFGVKRDESSERQESRRQLTPVFCSFFLQPELEEAKLPVHWIFQELSQPTVITLLATLLVGQPIVVVSPRSTALTLVTHALVELLRPLEWQHFFLPLCPVRTACALADRGFFASTSSSFEGQTSPPFIIGLEGELVHLKTKEEPRHRIRNSIYSVQRVNVQIRRPPLAPAHAFSCQHPDLNQYPPEILHTPAVILDVDADDIYVPDRIDVPEFPQTLVRSLEIMLKDAMLGGGLATQDSRLFCAPPSAPTFATTMLMAHAPLATVDSVRLAVLNFMESLLGDVTLFFCSFRKSFAGAAQVNEGVSTVVRPIPPDAYVLFEADAFLDAKIELGCREFFRHVFQTEMFRQYLVRHHRRFAVDNTIQT